MFRGPINFVGCLWCCGILLLSGCAGEATAPVLKPLGSEKIALLEEIFIDGRAIPAADSTDSPLRLLAGTSVIVTGRIRAGETPFSIDNAITPHTNQDERLQVVPTVALCRHSASRVIDVVASTGTSIKTIKDGAALSFRGKLDLSEVTGDYHIWVNMMDTANMVMTGPGREETVALGPFFIGKVTLTPPVN